MAQKEHPRIPMMRIKSYFIILIGVFLMVITYFSDALFTSSEKLFSILLSFSVSIATVGIIALVWDTLGGDPITNAIRRIQKQLSLRDIGFRDLYIRKSTESGDVFKKLQEEIRPGAQIKADLMGLVLQRNWFKKKDFRGEFLRTLNASKKCQFRILLPKPFGGLNDPDIAFENSKNLYQRVADEHIGKPEDTIVAEAEKMNTNIWTTLNTLKEIYNELDSGIKKKLDDDLKKQRDDAKKKESDDCNKPMLQVRVNAQNYMSCSVLRVNRRMFVINYLHKKGGEETPMQLLEGANAKLFKIYMDEFESVWKNSSEWDLESMKVRDSA